MQTSFSTNEDTPLTVSADVSDADADAITLQLLIAPSHGTLTVDQQATPPTITYTPASDFYGSDTLTVGAIDARGAQSANVVLSITVLSVVDPIAPAADMVTAPENGVRVLTAAELLANDLDEGEVSFVSVDATSAQGASVTITGADLSYDPGTQFDGLAVGETATDTFNYVAGGSGGTGSTTVTLTIIGANDAPVLSGMNTVTSSCRTNEPIGGSFSAGDVDGDPLVYSVTGGDCPPGISLDAGGVLGECPALGVACAAEISISDGTSAVTGSLTIGSNTVFVAEGGSGTGTSFADALGTITDGFLAVRPEGMGFDVTKDIWVQQGRYVGGPTGPSGGAPILAAGSLLDGFYGLKLYGGFSGSEVFYSDRGVPAQPSVLDGDSDGQPGRTAGSDTAHLLVLENLTDFLMDGFVLKNGYSNEGSGGAAAVISIGSFMTFRYVAFVGNEVQYIAPSGPTGLSINARGGAVFIENSPSVFFEHCTFSNNIAVGSASSGGAPGQGLGGALYARNSNVITIADSVFLTNFATNFGWEEGNNLSRASGKVGGGALYFDNVQAPTISRSFFADNHAQADIGETATVALVAGGRGGDAAGGAIRFDTRGTVSASTFIHNSAEAGTGGEPLEYTFEGPGGGGSGGAGGDAFGGAIAAEGAGFAGTLQGRFYANYLDAGIGRPGAQGMTGGTGGNGAKSGDALGGAIWIASATSTPPLTSIINSTFDANYAVSPRSGRGGAGGTMLTPNQPGCAGGNGAPAGVATGGTIAWGGGPGRISYVTVTKGEAYSGGLGVGGLGSPGTGTESGVFGANGIDGASGPTALFGGLAPTQDGALLVSSSVFYANTPLPLPSTGAFTGYDVSHVCADADFGASSAVLSSNPFTAATNQSNHLFLDATNGAACFALGDSALDGWQDKSTLATLVLDDGQPAPDAGAHTAPSEGVIERAQLSSTGELTKSVLGFSGTCTMHSTTGFFSVPANEASSMTAATTSVVLMCGGAHTSLSTN